MPAIVDKDAFDSASDKTKQLLIYGMIKEMSIMLAEHVAGQEATCTKRAEKCDGRFLKIERRKRVDVILSAGGGIIGGFLAVFAKWKFWPEG